MLPGSSLTGKRLVLALAATGLLCLAPFSQAYEILAYPGASSVAQGQTITFHVSTDLQDYDFRVYRFGADVAVVDQIMKLPGRLYPTPTDASTAGCGWPAALSFTIPLHWRSGVYSASFSRGQTYTYCLFVVRERNPGSTSKILYMVPYTTYQAYNNFGGKSLYDGGSTGGVRASTISMDRPFNYNNGLGQFNGYEQPFVQWMEKNGIIAEYCTNMDLWDHPEMLSRYQVYTTAGHDEYWSKEQRDALDAFRDSGRNIALFSANAGYWQIRLSNGGHSMTCYKDAASDPMRYVDPSRTTVRFRDPPLNRAEAQLFGVMYAGQSNFLGKPATVSDPAHWIFDGTGVISGDSLGTNIVGYEWDDLAAASPSGTRKLLATNMLGIGFGGASHSVGSYYEQTPEFGYPGGSGAKVFSAGTVQWSWGLDDLGYTRPDARIQRITSNIMMSFASPKVTLVDQTLVFRVNARYLRLRPADRVSLVSGLPGVGYDPGMTMLDDGLGADSVAGDGVYTLAVQIPLGTPQPLPYGFKLNGVTARMTAATGLAWVDDSEDAPNPQVLPLERIELPTLVDAPPTTGRRLALSASPARPNPSAGVSRISFTVPGREVPGPESDGDDSSPTYPQAKLASSGHGVRVQAAILDATGRRVSTLLDGFLLPGEAHLSWDGRDASGSRVGNGIYFCRIQSGGQVAAVKMVRLR